MELGDVLRETLRSSRGHILAPVIRMLGDIERAEDLLHDATLVALEKWRAEGIPENPGAWLSVVTRRRALDLLRREARWREKAPLVAAELEASHADVAAEAGGGAAAIPDDSLRLLFTCCHPALSLEAQIALTLRLIAGLTTREIARAFLVSETTLARRLVRAKRKIRDAAIPYSIPERDELSERIDGVLHVVSLVFNEGYSASSGEGAIRRELCEEGIRLGRHLCELLDEDPEARGLLALMLLNDARRDGRVDAEGRFVSLEQQDRSRWDRERIAEAMELLGRASLTGKPGRFQLQAAISGAHASSQSWEATPWRTILRLYDRLLEHDPSAVIELNRAVALAEVEGPKAGLSAIECANRRGALEDYQPYHAARANLLERVGAHAESAAAYERAIELAGNRVDRDHLEARRGGLDPPNDPVGPR